MNATLPMSRWDATLWRPDPYCFSRAANRETGPPEHYRGHEGELRLTGVAA